jgi:hypothetical protein
MGFSSKEESMFSATVRRPVATRFIAIALAGVLTMFSGAAAAQSYRYMDCDELWYARNEIYADAGYCFKTKRAIRAFGRACFPPYGKLTRSEQRRVDLIVSWETRKHCR